MQKINQKDYKRLEIYLWWTCNNRCLFCIEMVHMDRLWNTKVSEAEVLKSLVKYKKQWYNHVTYLWWEPFIQQNFWFALKVGKKLGYTILVTTNASMIQFNHIAEKFLPYIDELIISIPVIDKKLQPIINNTKSIIDFDRVFQNIKKYWKGSFLKVNVVLNPLNIDFIYNIVEYIRHQDVQEISLTYPDIDTYKYDEAHIKKYMILPYEQVIKKITPAVKFAISSWMRIKITDIPFCFFPDESRIPYTDDYDYAERTKFISANQEVHKRQSADYRKYNPHDIIQKYEDDKIKTKNSPRMRKYVSACGDCNYKWYCWGIAECYDDIYKDIIVNPIKHNE